MAVRALEALQAICERHNLKLFLLAGTCLGAVRHKGMIPWDDDIDVGLTYDDWYKLRLILPQELPAQYKYLDYDVNPRFPRMFGKILYDRRNCVDIFLIAKWTTNPIAGEFHWQVRRTATEFYKFSLNYNNPLPPTITRKEFEHYHRMKRIRKCFYKMLAPFWGRQDFIRLAKWNERYFEHHPYDCYINLYSIYKSEKEQIRKEWIENTSTVEFEGRQYTTVGDTDAYLTHLYGDYMTPPPVRKRVQSHEEKF